MPMHLQTYAQLQLNPHPLDYRAIRGVYRWGRRAEWWNMLCTDCTENPGDIFLRSFWFWLLQKCICTDMLIHSNHLRDDIFPLRAELRECEPVNQVPGVRDPCALPHTRYTLSRIISYLFRTIRNHVWGKKLNSSICFTVCQMVCACVECVHGISL